MGLRRSPFVTVAEERVNPRSSVDEPVARALCDQSWELCSCFDKRCVHKAGTPYSAFRVLKSSPNTNHKRLHNVMCHGHW
jgi:hypothetical protein